MQFEVNPKICDNSVYEIRTIENLIRNEYFRLNEVYRFFHLSDDASERIVAIKIKKQLTSIENELQQLKVFRKSLEKITILYKDNETNISEQLEKNYFHLPSIPMSPTPVNLTRLLGGNKQNVIRIFDPKS